MGSLSKVWHKYDRKVSGHNRFYRKNGRFHTKIVLLHRRKLTKIQTLNKTTEDNKHASSIYKYHSIPDLQRAKK